MEPEGSLPHSQQPATCPYPEQYQSSPCPLHPNTSQRSILTLSPHLPGPITGTRIVHRIQSDQLAKNPNAVYYVRSK
jgi:hypothetical protein